MDRIEPRYVAGLGLVLLVLAVVAFLLVAFGVTLLGMNEVEQLGAGAALATLARLVP